MFHHVMHECGPRPTIQLNIAVDTADYNMFTAAGSPGAAANCVLTIEAGINVFQSAGIAALRTGVWPAGSNLTIINHGTIGGVRGIKGNGATSVHHAGFDGGNGGDALYVESDVTIDNTDGLIGGGGGGGGGGGWGGWALSVPGDGGVGRDYNHAPTNGGSGNTFGSASSGDGGDGGDWGQNGRDGTWGFSNPGYRIVGSGPGIGGLKGNAVNLNGHVATWLAGNDSTHVKGPVA